MIFYYLFDVNALLSQASHKAKKLGVAIILTANPCGIRRQMTKALSQEKQTSSSSCNVLKAFSLPTNSQKTSHQHSMCIHNCTSSEQGFKPDQPELNQVLAVSTIDWKYWHCSYIQEALHRALCKTNAAKMLCNEQSLNTLYRS